MNKKQAEKIMLIPYFGRLVEPIYHLYRYIKNYRPWLSDESALKHIYRKKFGKDLDLVNPTGFSEKLQWIKLYHRDPLMVVCADKIESKKYIAEKVGGEYVNPTLLVTESSIDIRPENLPDFPFVIKTNHDQGTVYLVPNKHQLDCGKIRRKLNIAMKRNLYQVYREWPYDRINRRIFIEPHLNPHGETDLSDYKIFCFNGTPRVIDVHYARYASRMRTIYNEKWEALDVESGYPRGPSEDAPECLEEMLKVAKILSSPFPFVRVDFYIVNGRPLVGELTFFPAGGFRKFHPSSFDEWMGEMIELPAVKN